MTRIALKDLHMFIQLQVRALLLELHRLLPQSDRIQR
jgi:hypothetical protein